MSDASQRRRTRSAALSRSSSATASDFSMADFTIDLAKLGQRKSSMTMPKAETEAEGTECEDKGPKDFTLNMEKYMRMDEEWRTEGGGDVEERNEQKEDGKDCQQEDGNGWSGDNDEHGYDADENPEEDEEDGEQEVGDVRIHKDYADESEFEPLSTSTPAPLASQKRTTPVDVGSTDNGNLRPPPLSRLNTETIQTRQAEEVFEQISALQAEVERLRLGDQDHRYLNEMLKRVQVSNQDENGRLKTELQNVKTLVRGLQEEKGAIEKALAGEKKHREETRFKVEGLPEKFERLVQELAVVRSTADAEKKAADRKIATLEAKLLTSQMEITKEQKDNKTAQDAKEDEINNLRSVFEDLKRESSDYRQAIETQLFASQREIVNERKEVEALKSNQDEIHELRIKLDHCQRSLLRHTLAWQEQKDDHTYEISRLTQKVEAAKDLESNWAVQKMDLDHAHEQLRETRRTVETIEQENDRLNKESGRYRTENGEITGLLTRKGTELQVAESKIAELQDQLAGHQGEEHGGSTDAEAHESAPRDLQQQRQTGITELKTAHENDQAAAHQEEEHVGSTDAEAHKFALKELKEQHQTSIQELKTAHEKELKSLKSTVIRASDGMRKREHRVEKSHREELAGLRQKIASLEKSAALSKPSVPDPVGSADVTELRDSFRFVSSRLAAATAELEGTRLALTESQDALLESRAQTAEIRASKAATKQELEEEFAAATERREKEWRRRIGVMFRDREKMGKALMWAWGREEVGDKGKEAAGGKQGYRYRFVER